MSVLKRVIYSLLFDLRDPGAHPFLASYTVFPSWVFCRFNAAQVVVCFQTRCLSPKTFAKIFGSYFSFWLGISHHELQRLSDNFIFYGMFDCPLHSLSSLQFNTPRDTIKSSRFIDQHFSTSCQCHTHKLIALQLIGCEAGAATTWLGHRRAGRREETPGQVCAWKQRRSLCWSHCPVILYHHRASKVQTLFGMRTSQGLHELL